MSDEFQAICKGIGQQVRSLRKEKLISQEELAFRAEIDRTYVSQIERGIGNPSLLVLYKVVKVLEKDLQDLICTAKSEGS